LKLFSKYIKVNLKRESKKTSLPLSHIKTSEENVRVERAVGLKLEDMDLKIKT
jgi:hypothetical protein